MNLREVQSLRLKAQLARTYKEAAALTRYSEDGLSKLFSMGEMLPSDAFGKLREATSETSFPQLLRSGVQQFLFDAYEQVPVVYPDLVRVVNSNKYEELYAPLYGPELPKIIKAGQKFEDSRLAGLDTRLANVKFGRALNIECELVDDDMTGQIVQRASQLGERVRIFEEKMVMTELAGAKQPDGTTSWYTTTIGNVGGSGSGVTLTQTSLEAADIALEGITDPLGNNMIVAPDTVLVAPANKFNIAKLLQSALQPSVPGAAGEHYGSTSGITSGQTGYVMTVNPLQGLYAIKVSRYLSTSYVTGLDTSTSAWFLLQARKSLVWQDRDALEVAQEAPNSGEAFDRDVYRHRVRRRANTKLIEGRYCYRGN